MTVVVSVTTAGNVTATARNGSALGIGADFIAEYSGNTGSATIVSSGDIGATGRFGATGINALTIRSVYAGNAGDVSVTSNGDITAITETGRARGIYAVSSADNGQGGNVNVENTGDVTAATGGGPYSFAHGISAASFSFHGAAGDVSVMSNGNITGDTAAIYARSQGSTANGDIAITVLGGTVSGGTTGVGVEILDGADNSLINRGTITSLSGTAIMASTGNEIIDNDGIVTGSVLLGTGLNAFNNLSGGLFNSGADVFLGGGNLLTNSGKLAPAGIGTIGTTALTGDLRQTGSGGFDVDVDMTTNSADLLTASGTADLSGKVEPNILKLQLQSDPVTILSAAGGIVKNGISVQDTAVVDYTLLFPNSTDMQLAISRFRTGGSEPQRDGDCRAPEQRSLCGGINEPQSSAVCASRLFRAMGSLANALDQLSPEVYLDTEIASLFSNLAFTNSMMTCPEPDGAYAFIREGQCVWARVSGRFYDQDTTFQTLGFNETNFQVSGGGQVALGGAWRSVAPLAMSTASWRRAPTRKAMATGSMAAVCSLIIPVRSCSQGRCQGVRGSYDIDRPIAFPGFSALAKGDTDIDNLEWALASSLSIRLRRLVFEASGRSRRHPVS